MPTVKKNILLMENNAGYAHLFQESVRQFAGDEFNPIHEKGVPEALRKLNEEKIDLVLLDLFLTSQASQEILVKFQETDAMTPIVVLTGHSSERITLFAPHWAPVIFLPKNIWRGGTLLNTLRHYMDRR